MLYHLNLILCIHLDCTKTSSLHEECTSQIRSDCPIKGKMCSGSFSVSLEREEKLWFSFYTSFVFISAENFQFSNLERKTRRNMKSTILSAALLFFLSPGTRSVENFFSNLLSITAHIYPLCLGAN